MKEKVCAIVTAAGASRRMAGLDKIFALVAGKPVLAHTLQAFQSCDLIAEVVLVLSEANLPQGEGLVRTYGFSKVTAICPGGKLRQDSVRQGLSLLHDCAWAVIHDGARPCVTPDLIEAGLAAARQTGAAIAAVPVKDTIKRVDPTGTILETPHRAALWSAQTPQVFRFDIIFQAYSKAQEEATDDAALVEAMGREVKVYMGSYDNIKITTQADLALADVILMGRQ